MRIEPDGRVIPPIGPAVSGGNMLQHDWKPIARSEVFRALQRRREAAVRCAECPGWRYVRGMLARDGELERGMIRRYNIEEKEHSL